MTTSYSSVHIRKFISLLIRILIFQKGDHVELLDSAVSLRVRPACVEKVIGTRIHVRISQIFLDRYGTNDDDSQVRSLFCEFGVWMDQDSPLIFPVGWALKVGYKLEANDDYIKHAKEVSVKANDSEYEKHENPSPSKMCIKTEEAADDIMWEKGMKLEVLDPLDTWKELRVSTVMEVMSDGFLKVGVQAFTFRIGFDGDEMESDPVPLHSTSELLFPVGYAQKYGIRLKGPKDTGI
ncbi:unnamed protein product [Brugia pahangi]|uniref:Agenet domain-containing protein n=1 Tax=Brugia pahangi TaxID=6280 RepID=A0A0N4TD34_BRUPA|nr:unnamed protein product [Brugia pahangi]